MDPIRVKAFLSQHLDALLISPTCNLEHEFEIKKVLHRILNQSKLKRDNLI